jgi:hypothetical protein
VTILGLDLPSTYLASDLAWRLNDSVELNERRDGGCSMVVEVSGSLGRTLSLIRDWTTASGLGSVDVALDGKVHKLVGNTASV